MILKIESGFNKFVLRLWYMQNLWPHLIKCVFTLEKHNFYKIWIVSSLSHLWYGPRPCHQIFHQATQTLDNLTSKEITAVLCVPFSMNIESIASARV